MDRLFLTVYAKLFAAIVCAVLVANVFVAPGADRRAERNFADSLTPSMKIATTLLAEEHARGGNLDAALARAAPAFRIPTALVSQNALESELPPEVMAQLARGEIVQTRRFPSPVMFAAIAGTDQVLKIGPLATMPPLGEGRSLRLVALVVTGLLVGVYLVLRPVRIRLAALSRVASALGGGDLTARAVVGPTDAIGHLASALNYMADELTRQIAAQQELLHMVSHELRTPLQRMRFNAEALRAPGEASQREIVLKRVDRDVEELDELLSELLAYVRLGNHATITPAKADVRALLADLCETLSDTRGQIELSLRDGDPVHTSVDARLLRRAVSNLVINALAYAKHRVEVSVDCDGDTIRIQVDDDGTGIADAARERVFQPFQRLDDEANGTRKTFGLGLAIVRRVAELHGGHASAHRSDLGGARLSIALPNVA